MFEFGNPEPPPPPPSGKSYDDLERELRAERTRYEALSRDWHRMRAVEREWQFA